MSIPHDDIRANKDRSWSMRLVEEIASGNSDDLEAIEDTLLELADPKVDAPLMAIIKNTDLPLSVRTSASDALSYTSVDNTYEQRRAWWHSGDPLLKSLAVALAEREDADLIRPIVTDPHHPFYLEGIAVAQYWDEPEFQRLLCDALESSNLPVKRIAADSMKWDEPIRSEETLLQCANYPDEKLVETALYSLHWFGSRKVLLGLETLSKEGLIDFRELQNEFFECNQYRMIEEIELNLDACKDWLAPWLREVSHLIDLNEIHPFDRSKSITGKPEISVQGKEQCTIEELLAVLSESDGYWNDKLWQLRKYDWKMVANSKRLEVARFLTTHPDEEVRREGCEALGAWNFTDHLVQILVSSSSVQLARAAAYNMKFLDKDECLAPLLWDWIQKRKTVSSTTADFFNSFVVHTPVNTLDDLLTSLILEDDREGIASTAVYHLSELKRSLALSSVKSIVSREPLISWQVHTAFIESVADFPELKLDLSHLRNADQIDLQIAIAKYLKAHS